MTPFHDILQRVSAEGRDKQYEWKEGREQTNSKAQTEETLQVHMSGVSLNRYQFIFDWHQGKLLPAPAYGITPQNSELLY